MLKTALLALALALGGGAPHLGVLVDLMPVLWIADQVDGGNNLDPDGAGSSDAGNRFDPDGATSDAGNNLDPNG